MPILKSIRWVFYLLMSEGRIQNVRPTKYNGIYFRSSLESKIAKIMDLLKIHYVYEPLRICLIPSFYYNGKLQRELTYKPDFIVNNKIIIECKGFATPEWKIKKKLFLQYLIRNNNYIFFEVHSEKDLFDAFDKCNSMIEKSIKVTNIKTGENNLYDSVSSAMEDLNLIGKSTGNINSCIIGKRKSAYGYKWEYVYVPFQTLNNEEWKPVVGFENLYKVSSLGRVVSTQFHGSNYCKLLNSYKGAHGYLHVKLRDWKNNIAISYPIHRLVAEAFIPNPEKKSQVDHIDTNIVNNTLSNLRWVTPYENMHNVITEKRIKDAVTLLNKTDTHKKAITEAEGFPIVQIDKTGTIIGKFPSISIAAKELNTTATCIWRVCKGLRKQHKGYIFKFITNGDKERT